MLVITMQGLESAESVPEATDTGAFYKLCSYEQIDGAWIKGA